MDPQKQLHQWAREGLIDDKLLALLESFLNSYIQAVTRGGREAALGESLFMQFLDYIIETIEHPYTFAHYHHRIRIPIDYYQFGLDFMRPLIDFSRSKVLGVEQIQEIEMRLSLGENVVLLANHQIEPDPQVISLLLEPIAPHLGEEMIFVAGHRVTTDPLAVPFSKGRNLLCIYSKRHIENPPEEKEEKRLHNQKVMKRMGQLLAEGGKCIYVAPSGGRDRPDEDGEVLVAPFDPSTIELFALMSSQSGKPTHFYPLTLVTYDLMPPPDQVEKDVGESRRARFVPAHIAFGEAFDMDAFLGSEGLDRHQLRRTRAQTIWEIVNDTYQQLRGDS